MIDRMPQIQYECGRLLHKIIRHVLLTTFFAIMGSKTRHIYIRRVFLLVKVISINEEGVCKS